MEDNVIITPAPKYSLTKKFESEEQLKIYFMGVIPNPTQFMGGEFKPRYVGILSYTHDAAIKKANEAYSNNGSMVISSYGDNETIENLLKNINYESNVKNVSPEPEKPKIMPMETFKASLLMASEEYVKLGAHKIAIKRIIETL